MPEVIGAPKVLDLFSGIGGFSLGFRAAGARIVAHSEIERFPCRILKERFPGVPNLGDVSGIDGEALRGSVDVVTFGSPCQDLSSVGSGKGLEGEKSGLFHEAIRIVRGCRPEFAVWENVPGALWSNGRRDFGTVLDALADAGALDVAWRVLDAQWFGVPQRRRRVFLVADFGEERAGEVLLEPERVPHAPADVPEPSEGSAAKDDHGAHGADGHGAVEVVHASRMYTPSQASCGVSKDAAVTLLTSENPGGFQAIADPNSGEMRRFSSLERERLMGFPDGWTDLPDASDAARCKALGNAVVPSVVEWIAKRLVRARRQSVEAKKVVMPA